MAGIFIVEGMTVSIPKFQLSINERGELIPSISFELSYDACIAWAKIALEHRSEALLKMEERRTAWQAQPQNSGDVGRALTEEFSASMQAIVAAAICIDALYDHLIPHSPIKKATRDAWKEKRTARYAQIAETIQTTFKINNAGSKQIREHLKVLFLLRDKAVHPSNVPMPVQTHSELNVGTDWRLTVYRGEVADAFVCIALGILWDITHHVKYRTPELAELVQKLKNLLERLLPDGKPTPEVATVNIQIPQVKPQKITEPRPKSWRSILSARVCLLTAKITTLAAQIQVRLPRQK